jgi:hypothetical protein
MLLRSIINTLLLLRGSSRRGLLLRGIIISNRHGEGAVDWLLCCVVIKQPSELHKKLLNSVPF